MSQATVDAIIERLKELQAAYRVSVHAPVRTSEEAARVRGVPLESGVKALVCKAGSRKGEPAEGEAVPEGALILVLAKGDEKADLKRVAELEGVRKLSFASPEEVVAATDCVPGSVPPFGFGAIKTYFDRRIRAAAAARAQRGLPPEVNFNIGLLTHSVTVSEEALERALGEVAEY